jgi:hypothetical protein
MTAFLCRATRNPPAPECRLRGWVEGLREGRLEGWAFSAEDTKRRLIVRVESAGGPSLRIRADRYRWDVQRLKTGSDGYCGFSLPLRGIEAKEPLKVVAEEFEAELPHVPSEPARAAFRKFILGRQGLKAALDPIGARVSGWVAEIGSAPHRRRVNLVVDGSLVETMRATLYRRDAELQLGDGFCGFSLARPDIERSWTLEDADSGATLTSFRARRR